MLNSKTLAAFLMTVVVYTTADCGTPACHTEGSAIVRSHYEETLSYFRNPQCKPSNFDTGIKCSAVGSPITVQGGLVSILSPC